MVGRYVILRMELGQKQQSSFCMVGAMLLNLAVLGVLFSGAAIKDAPKVMPIRFFEVSAPAGASVATAAVAAPAAPAEKQAKAEPVQKQRPVEPAKPRQPALAKVAPQPQPAPIAEAAPAAPAETAAAVAAQNVSQASAETGAAAGEQNVSSVVTEPRYRRTTQPVYPESAVEMGVEGTVVLHALVDASGHAKLLRIAQSSGSSALDMAAEDAVRGWEFEPSAQNGAAAESWVRVPVKFALN